MPPNLAEALDEHQTSKIIEFLNITNIIKKLKMQIQKCKVIIIF